LEKSDCEGCERTCVCRVTSSLVKNDISLILVLVIDLTEERSYPVAHSIQIVSIEETLTCLDWTTSSI
jgi:hypothetical protein